MLSLQGLKDVVLLFGHVVKDKITGCFTPNGVSKKLATLNPENITVNVISIDI
jgi:hypothetical protein